MNKNQRGFSVYTVISILAFLLLVFVLTLPQFFNLDKKEKADECVHNMKIIYRAVANYMKDRKEDFKGDTVDLIRTGYMKKTYECPEDGPGDKYIIEGHYDTGVIIVKCPHEEEFPSHKLPPNFK